VVPKRVGLSLREALEAQLLNQGQGVTVTQWVFLLRRGPLQTPLLVEDRAGSFPLQPGPSITFNSSLTLLQPRPQPTFNVRMVAGQQEGFDRSWRSLETCQDRLRVFPEVSGILARIGAPKQNEPTLPACGCTQAARVHKQGGCQISFGSEEVAEDRQVVPTILVLKVPVAVSTMLSLSILRSLALGGTCRRRTQPKRILHHTRGLLRLMYSSPARKVVLVVPVPESNPP